jgi:hypothetical protein
MRPILWGHKIFPQKTFCSLTAVTILSFVAVGMFRGQMIAGYVSKQLFYDQLKLGSYRWDHKKHGNMMLKNTSWGQTALPVSPGKGGNWAPEFN